MVRPVGHQGMLERKRTADHEGDEVVPPMRHNVGRLFDEFAVAPDAVTWQVGANVKIDPEGRDTRIADLGDANDRARLRIELAEAMKRGGELFRQNR
jgi:hypothetical protein